MAKQVPDSQNRYRQTWEKAREQGVSRKVVADSLGMSQRRLSTLISGAERPTLGEVGSLSGRRGATLVRYEDELGAGHAFYTGRGMSFENLVASGALYEIADEIAERNDYPNLMRFMIMESRSPKHPAQTPIYPTNRTLREQTGGVKKYL